MNFVRRALDDSVHFRQSFLTNQRRNLTLRDYGGLIPAALGVFVFDVLDRPARTDIGGAFLDDITNAYDVKGTIATDKLARGTKTVGCFAKLFSPLVAACISKRTDVKSQGHPTIRKSHVGMVHAHRWRS